MTVNYGVKQYRAREMFFQQLEQPNRLYQKDEKTMELKQFVAVFLDFLERLFKDDKKFERTSESIKLSFASLYKNTKNKNSYSIITNDETRIVLYYLESRMIRLQRKIGTEKRTAVLQDLKDILDIKKTEQALRANIIHAIDGAVLRIVVQSYDKEIKTLHDCFGVEIMDADKIVDIYKIALQEVDAATTISELLSTQHTKPH